MRVKEGVKVEDTALVTSEQLRERHKQAEV